MSEGNEAELGRSKYGSTPQEHLRHLLTIGWSPKSPLILKYVAENRLQRELAAWQELEDASMRKPAVKK
ncbi:MAG: hypothetical protein IT343_02010 [Candidatus Melainabacteria bacterium]|jgi:hypothetical protein|nr:hypothetical protein [Candidatus Melainabacteria bacterium]